MSKETLHDYCFVEAQEYELKKHKSIPKDIIDQYCELKNDKLKFNLCGFLVYKNDILIIFPKNFKISLNEFELVNQVQTLAQTLIRYNNEKNLQSNELLGDIDSHNEEGIASALWLIHDYIEYGFIRKDSKKYSDSGANIDWQRTMKTTQPIISSSNVLYLNPYYLKNKSDTENFIVNLHKYAIQKSMLKFAWILGYKFEEYDPIFVELPCEKTLAVYLLEKELNFTFSDREMKLINNLIEFIQGSHANSHKITIDTMATKYFHTVWEAMCKFVFKDQSNSLKSILPRPVWYLENGKTKETQQIPDILVHQKLENNFYILDAKYYNSPKTLPGWQDLVKQFYYFYSLPQRFNKVYNILLFPGQVEKKIEILGYIEMHNREELGRIFAYTLDVYSLMNDYSNYNYNNWQSLLISEIDR